MAKRGPRAGSPAMLRRSLAALRKRKKTRHGLPSSRMWPGQVRAGADSLFKMLHRDPFAGNKGYLYDQELEGVVRAVFRACVAARVERAKILKRRAEKRSRDASS